MAGSTMIYIDDTGTAGIYMVGVKGKFRKQGLGKELILFCLDRLKKRGIDKCYLQSTRMGAPLYKSLNFQERDKYLIFCKVK
jgi:ribosomal protein S18 acetylase RimI-like enzyme